VTPEPVQPARTFSVPLLSVPISTVIIIIVAIVGGVDLIVNGNLSPDFTNYIGIVAGSSGLLAIGRGLDSHSKP
jgi:hypothetical protein